MIDPGNIINLVTAIPFFGRLYKLLLNSGPFENAKQEYLIRLTRLRTGLVASLSPGELDLSIISPKRKDDADRSPIS